MMAYIWTLRKDGDGHFSERNRGKKAEKFDMFKKLKVVYLDELCSRGSF